MADEPRIGLSELLRKSMIDHDADFLREGIRVLSQALMEMEVEEHVGAARQERSVERVGRRNGYRRRNWGTRVGIAELSVPRVCEEGYFPSLLEHVGGPSGRSPRWSRRRTCTGSPPARWTSW